ncbi:MAG: hypothetical protein ACO4AI_02685 [Prochlorothrix sp.]
MAYTSPCSPAIPKGTAIEKGRDGAIRNPIAWVHTYPWIPPTDARPSRSKMSCRSRQASPAALMSCSSLL